MTIFLPEPTKATRSALAPADRVPVVHPIPGLATFSTTVSNGAKAAALKDLGPRLVKVKSPSSPAGPDIGRNPPFITHGEPMIATFADCPVCGVATAAGLPSADSVASSTSAV